MTVLFGVLAGLGAAFAVFGVAVIVGCLCKLGDEDVKDAGDVSHAPHPGTPG